MRSAQTQRMASAGYLTIAKAAELMGVSRQTVYTWIEAKKLRPTMVGPRRYISMAAIVAHVGDDGAAAMGITGEKR